MSTNVTFKYGDYEFSPRPLLSINSEPLKTPDGSGYGVIHKISLEGDLISTTAAELDSGILQVFNDATTLREAISEDGKLLVIDCNGSGIVSGYPRIESYSISPESDNFTRRAGYTIDFEMPTINLGSGNDPFNSSIYPPFIESCSESWDVEFADERMPFDWTVGSSTFEKFGYKLAVTHTVDVQARIAYTGDRVSNIPWDDARSYATGRLGFDNEFVTLTGVLGLPGTGYFTQIDTFNNYRQVSVDKTNGSIQVVETFIVTPSGSGSLPNNAIETFDISSSQSEGVTTVSINGEIEGLCNLGYTGDGSSNSGFYSASSKYSAASGYYNIVKGRMFDRASAAYSSISGACSNRALNSTVRTRTIGINPVEGRVSYNYEYDTVPSGCLTGLCLLSQNLSIDDVLQTDVTAQHVIPGRAAGPIIQDIGTITARTRTVNVELVVLPPTDCSTVTAIYSPVPTGQVQNFIDVISGDLLSNYSQVFVSSQTQNWNFSVGRYTKTIAFTYNNCTS